MESSGEGQRSRGFSLHSGIRKIQGKYAKHTYDYIDDMLLANYNGLSALFAKNMAYFIPKRSICEMLRGQIFHFSHKKPSPCHTITMEDL